MGRPVCPELVAPEREAKNYIREQEKHAKRHGFPTMAAFANAIAKGTVSLAPTPEDPQLEFVGKFMWRLPHLWFLVISSCYDSTGETVPFKALKLRIKEREYKDIRQKVLWSLRGYLMASGE
jgi:hypothetical protein